MGTATQRRHTTLLPLWQQGPHARTPTGRYNSGGTGAKGVCAREKGRAGQMEGTSSGQVTFTKEDMQDPDFWDDSMLMQAFEEQLSIYRKQHGGSKGSSRRRTEQDTFEDEEDAVMVLQEKDVVRATKRTKKSDKKSKRAKKSKEAPESQPDAAAAPSTTPGVGEVSAEEQQRAWEEYYAWLQQAQQQQPHGYPPVGMGGDYGYGYGYDYGNAWAGQYYQQPAQYPPPAPSFSTLAHGAPAPPPMPAAASREPFLEELLSSFFYAGYYSGMYTSHRAQPS